jgi:hypothetical protein
LLLATTVACDENVTGPARRELALSVCPTNTWVAFRNEGGAWTRLGGSSGGDVTIMATDRLAVAYTSTTTQSPVLWLYFISADQAQSVLGCQEPNQYQTRNLSGTVQGLTSSNHAQLSIGPTSGFLDVNSNTFTLPYAAAGTRDLFAMRHTPSSEGLRVDRMIVRRAQAHSDGTIPLLDFGSSEAIAPTQNTVSWTASGAQVQVDFIGADGNVHLVQSFVVGAYGAPVVPWMVPFYSVPANRQVQGDLHSLMLFSEDRSIHVTYQQPANLTLTLGPFLMEPTFTPIATSPSLSAQATLPWQPEYDGRVSIQLTQAASQAPRTVNITLTREHVLSGGSSAPAAWTVTLPVLSGVGGLPSGIGLEAGAPFNWSVFATSRRWAAGFGVGAAGDVYRSASRSGTSN